MTTDQTRADNSPNDWWKPEPSDPFWMLEAEDGEWLKNRDSLLGTKDATKAIRFPTEQAARNHPANMITSCKWWDAKPTKHKWIVPAPIDDAQVSYQFATDDALVEAVSQQICIEDGNCDCGLARPSCGIEKTLFGRYARAVIPIAQAPLRAQLAERDAEVSRYDNALTAQVAVYEDLLQRNIGKDLIPRGEHAAVLAQLAERDTRIAKLTEALGCAHTQFAAIGLSYGAGADAAHLMHMASIGEYRTAVALKDTP